MSEIPYGHCHCGCGQRTKPAQKTQLSKGRIKGQPQRYLYQHQCRSSPVEYVEDPDTGCWVWQRSMASNGYGMLRGEGTCMAHRAYYERTNGPVPGGLELDHLCRNRACVNPDHLEPVTRQENMRRGINTKLDMEKAREIRRLVASGVSQSEVARRFGVTTGAVWPVVHGLKWAEPAREAELQAEAA